MRTLRTLSCYGFLIREKVTADAADAADAEALTISGFGKACMNKRRTIACLGTLRVCILASAAAAAVYLLFFKRLAADALIFASELAPADTTDAKKRAHSATKTNGRCGR